MNLNAGAVKRNAMLTPLVAERIQKCAALAKELAMMSGSVGFDIATIERMKPKQDQIRLTCPNTGFECTLSQGHPEKDRCEPFAWFGGKDFIRSTMDGAKFNLKLSH